MLIASNAIVKTYWMKREACLQGQFVVKMYWLKEHDFHNCRNGAFVGSAEVGMVRNRNAKGKFFSFHIFGNNLKVRPVRAIKLEMAPLLMETFHMTRYLQKSAQRSRRRSPDKTRKKKEKDKKEKKNWSDFYSSPLTLSKRTN